MVLKHFLNIIDLLSVSLEIRLQRCKPDGVMEEGCEIPNKIANCKTSKTSNVF